MADSPASRTASVWLLAAGFAAVGIGGFVALQESRRNEGGRAAEAWSRKEARKRDRAQYLATFRELLLSDSRLSVEADGTVVATPDFLSSQLLEAATHPYDAGDEVDAILKEQNDAYFSQPHVFHKGKLTYTVTRTGKELRTVITHPDLTPELVEELRQARRDAGTR